MDITAQPSANATLIINLKTAVPTTLLGRTAEVVGCGGCDKTTRRANHFRFTEIMSSPEIKNISLFQKTNQGTSIAILSRSEGRWPSSQRGTGRGGR